MLKWVIGIDCRLVIDIPAEKISKIEEMHIKQSRPLFKEYGGNKEFYRNFDINISYELSNQGV